MLSGAGYLHQSQVDDPFAIGLVRRELAVEHIRRDR
jgi:hypothetical protein